MKTSVGLEDMLETITRLSGVTRLTLIVYEHDRISPYDVSDDESVKQKVVVTPGKMLSTLKVLEEKAKNDDLLISIGSEVFVGKNKKHLYLIDFDTPECPADFGDGFLPMFNRFAKEFELPPGFVLNSGHSYHFYGDTTIVPQTWNDILERLKGSKYVDHSWIKRSLGRGFGMLRVTTNSDKKAKLSVIEAYGLRLSR